MHSIYAVIMRIQSGRIWTSPFLQLTERNMFVEWKVILIKSCFACDAVL